MPFHYIDAPPLPSPRQPYLTLMASADNSLLLPVWNGEQEISAYAWHEIKDLPTTKDEFTAGSYVTEDGSRHRSAFSFDV